MSAICVVLVLLISFGATDCTIIGKETSTFFELKLISVEHNFWKIITFSSDVTDYWPEVKHDLTKVIWSHATNSQNKLQKALEGKYT